MPTDMKINDAELAELRTAAIFEFLGQNINIARIEETDRRVTVIGYFDDGGPARVYLRRA